ILTCFDLTATPFAPTGKKSGQETLFGWIVSDFGLKIKLIMEENGRLGEEHVLNAERARLRRVSPELAAKVRWISQESVAEGYDIISFEQTGEERFIEVKATAGQQNTFEMSDNEWQKACELGEQYVICRVTNVRDDPAK